MKEAAPVGAATSFARPAHPGFWLLPAVAAIEENRQLSAVGVEMRALLGSGDQRVSNQIQNIEPNVE